MTSSGHKAYLDKFADCCMTVLDKALLPMEYWDYRKKPLTHETISSGPTDRISQENSQGLSVI